MASDIWLKTILIVREETHCHHIGYSFRLTARVLLYAPFHRQDSTYHGLCYTSHGALEREIAQWVHHMKDRSDDPSHHERMLLPWSYISLPLPQSYISLLHESQMYFIWVITILTHSQNIVTVLHRRFKSLDSKYLQARDLV